MSLPPTIQSVLQSASLQLGTAEAKLEAQLLLQEILKVNRAWLIAHAKERLQAAHYQAFQDLVQRRLAGEPIAYILGSREFYALNLMVTPDTLIPRSDTETLVEAALAKIAQPSHAKAADKNTYVLDLGTGCGAVALAIASKRPQAQVVAVDSSHAALTVAKKNALNLNAHNVQWLMSNWFEQLSPQRFDVIVSNPPYIEENNHHLTQGDLRFEPLSALASGQDGLNDIRTIIENCMVYLNPQGWLMLEHGYNQADQVTELMSEIGLIEIATMKDLGQNNRVTMGKNPLNVSAHWA